MISKFRDEYYFLSNMFPCKIEDKNLIFDSAESCFQSYKVKNRELFIGLDGYKARKLGRKVKIEEEDWENKKLEIMKHILFLKFSQNPDLKTKLLATKNEELCENNTWNDTFWGTCNGIGENYLGKLLMEIRKSLSKKMMITGLRVQKLPVEYGFDYKNNTWSKVIKLFKELLIKYQITEAITGMAIGADTAFACAVMQLKKEGYNISLNCYLPDPFQDEKWNEYSKKIYQEILKRADVVIYQSNEYSLFNYLNRNARMVENADIVLGFWDMLSDGGTASTLEKAQKKQKQIILINPLDLKITENFKIKE